DVIVVEIWFNCNELNDFSNTITHIFDNTSGSGADSYLQTPQTLHFGTTVPVTYEDRQRYGESKVNVVFAMIEPGQVFSKAIDNSLAWVKTSGRTNVYEMAINNVIHGILCQATRVTVDKLQYKKVADVATVDATIKSWVVANDSGTWKVFIYS